MKHLAIILSFPKRNTTDDDTTDNEMPGAVGGVDFDDTPLSVAADTIKEVYGLSLVNLPENADDYSLSLHYEGAAARLVGAINDVFRTDMRLC